MKSRTNSRDLKWKVSRYSEAYLEPDVTSMMEGFFAKVVNRF